MPVQCRHVAFSKEVFLAYLNEHEERSPSTTRWAWSSLSPPGPDFSDSFSRNALAAAETDAEDPLLSSSQEKPAIGAGLLIQPRQSVTSSRMANTPQ